MGIIRMRKFELNKKEERNITLRLLTMEAGKWKSFNSTYKTTKKNGQN